MAGNVRFYQVKQGDTLSALAPQFGVPWAQVAEFNQLKDPNKIDIGQVLMIPPMAEEAAPMPTAPPPPPPDKNWTEVGSWNLPEQQPTVELMTTQQAPEAPAAPLAVQAPAPNPIAQGVQNAAGGVMDWMRAQGEQMARTGESAIDPVTTFGGYHPQAAPEGAGAFSKIAGYVPALSMAAGPQWGRRPGTAGYRMDQGPGGSVGRSPVENFTTTAAQSRQEMELAARQARVGPQGQVEPRAAGQGMATIKGRGTIDPEAAGTKVSDVAGRFARHGDDSVRKLGEKLLAVSSNPQRLAVTVVQLPPKQIALLRRASGPEWNNVRATIISEMDPFFLGEMSPAVAKEIFGSATSKVGMRGAAAQGAQRASEAARPQAGPGVLAPMAGFYSGTQGGPYPRTARQVR